MILNGENILSATNGPVDIRSILKATTMNIVIDLDAFDVIGSLGREIVLGIGLII